MFELLVPVTPARLARSGGDKKKYDRGPRPELMVRAITELQEAGVEADVWKVEGLDRPEDCARVVATARRGGRERVGCIVLGRGEDNATTSGLASLRSLSKPSRRSGNGTAAALDTRNIGGPRASRPRPGPSGRVWPTVWAWPWAAAGWLSTLTARASMT